MLRKTFRRHTFLRWTFLRFYVFTFLRFYVFTFLRFYVFTSDVVTSIRSTQINRKKSDHLDGLTGLIARRVQL
jgi:hypothetical protein